MKDWRIGIKLALGFGVLILISLGVAGIFSGHAWYISKNLGEIRNEYLPLSTQTAELHNIVLRIPASFNQFLYSGETQAWDDVEALQEEAFPTLPRLAAANSLRPLSRRIVHGGTGGTPIDQPGRLAAPGA